MRSVLIYLCLLLFHQITRQRVAKEVEQEAGRKEKELTSAKGVRHHLHGQGKRGLPLADQGPELRGDNQPQSVSVFPILLTSCFFLANLKCPFLPFFSFRWQRASPPPPPPPKKKNK